MYYQQFQEVYFGESNNIKEMQQCITNFRRDLMRNPLLAKLNTHPEIKRFNRLAEKEFGFSCFNLCIDPSLMINAYTLPIWYHPGTLSKSNSTMGNLIVTKKGYRYKEGNDYVVFICVFRGLLLEKDITDREVMAVILHEIGHNFQGAISNVQASMSGAAYVLTLVDAIINILYSRTFTELCMNIAQTPLALLGVYNKLQAAIDDILYKHFRGIYHTVDVVNGLLETILFPAMKVLKFVGLMLTIPLIPIKIINSFNPMNIVRRLLKGTYRGEKVSDNFATIYGYGPEIASVQTKFMGDDLLNKVKLPIVAPLLGFMEATIKLLLSLPDEHPQAITRIKDQRDYLEKEIMFGDYDPKFKKEMKHQIGVIDNMIEDITDLTYKGSISDYKYFDRMYQCILYRLFGGDLKELTPLNPDDIHSDLEEVRKKKMNESVEGYKKKFFGKIKLK